MTKLQEAFELYRNKFSDEKRTASKPKKSVSSKNNDSNLFPSQVQNLVIPSTEEF